MTGAAILTLILQAVQAALVAAPQVAEIVTQAKALITSLTTAALITKAQQDAAHKQVDAIAALVDAGIVPPGLQVEPDPPTA